MKIISRIFAFIILLVLFPLFFIISFISFIFQGTPILFYQKRTGFKNKQFNIYKFRTMIDNDSMTKLSTLNDSRVTKWGKF